jgi:hypothetical protein
MQFRKTAASVVLGLALPFSALSAPAFASDDDDDKKDPKVHIEEVDIEYGKHKKVRDIEVEVDYRCGKEKDRDDSDDDDDDDDGKKKGYLRVVLRQDDAKWSGDEWVECTGKWKEVTVDLDRDKEELERGWARVRAVLEAHGEEAKDKDDVWIKGKKKDDD